MDSAAKAFPDVDFEKIKVDDLEYGDGLTFTPSQSYSIYTKDLNKIKQNIIRIDLLDSEKAKEFEERLNSIISNIKDNTITHSQLTEITNLENDIIAYLGKDGTEKKSDFYFDSLNIIFNKLSSIMDDISIEEAINYITKIRKILSTSYIDINRRKDSESKYNSLVISCITKALKKDSSFDIKSLIVSDTEKTACLAYFATKAKKLDKSDDLHDIEIANSIKSSIINDDESIYKPSFWKLLYPEIELSQHQELSQSETENTETENTETDINSGSNTFNSNISENDSKDSSSSSKNNNDLTINNQRMKKIIRKIKRIPIYPLDEDDIRYMDYEWIINHISEEKRYEFEKERLKKEGLKADELYLPSPEEVLITYYKDFYVFYNEWDWRRDYIPEGSKMEKFVKNFKRDFKDDSDNIITVETDITDVHPAGSEYGYRFSSIGASNKKNSSNLFFGNRSIWITIQIYDLLDKLLDSNYLDPFLNKLYNNHLYHYYKPEDLYFNLNNNVGFDDISYISQKEKEREEFYRTHGCTKIVPEGTEKSTKNELEECKASKKRKAFKKRKALKERKDSKNREIDNKEDTSFDER